MGGADMGERRLAIRVVSEGIATSEWAGHCVAIQCTRRHIAGAVFQKSEIPWCSTDEVARVVADPYIGGRGHAGLRRQGARGDIGLSGVDSVLNALPYEIGRIRHIGLHSAEGTGK
jgi:hypothetical protein